MRLVSVSGNEFQFFVWPVIVGSQAENASEFEVAVRFLRKLKKVSSEFVTDKDDDDPNQLIVRSRKLNEYPTQFILEEDEHRLFLKRIKEGVKGVSIGLAEEYSLLLEKVKDAEEYTPPAEVKKEEEEEPVEPDPPTSDDEEEPEK